MIEQLVVGPLETNAWIVPLKAEGKRRKHSMIVDPGGNAEEIISRVEALKTPPSLIVFTHGHFDHMQAAGQIVQHFSSETWVVDVAIHRIEAGRTGTDSERIHRSDFSRVGGLAYINEYWRPVPQATRLLDNGDRLDSFEVIHVPGHSQGSIALYDSRKDILISGDCLFRRGVGRTDLPGGDQEALHKSLHRLLALPGKTLVLPGHGPNTNIAQEQSWLAL